MSWLEKPRRYKTTSVLTLGWTRGNCVHSIVLINGLNNGPVYLNWNPQDHTPDTINNPDSDYILYTKDVP